MKLIELFRVLYLIYSQCDSEMNLPETAQNMFQIANPGPYCPAPFTFVIFSFEVVHLPAYQPDKRYFSRRAHLRH